MCPSTLCNTIWQN